MSTGRVGRPALAGLLVVLAATMASAREGLLLDEKGNPIEDAHTCLLSGQLETFCTRTDAQGKFRLPDAPATGFRIQALGYQLLELPAEMPDEPFVMERAATLMLKVVDDATGEPVPSSEAFIREPDGRRRGPAPVNRHGLKLGTLKPGLIRIEVVADGYEQKALGQAMLIKGKTTEATVRLHPVGPAPAGD